MPSLRDIGEIAFIESIERLAGGRTRGVKVGIGDDAAVVAAGKSTVLTTDTQREGVHFRRDWLSAAELGRRAFRVAVSDVAAMAATPRYVLLSFGAPPKLDAAWARALIAAFVAEAHASDTALVGGNVNRDEAVSLAVTVIGEAPKRALLRRDARPGDLLWVTGALGGAAAGVEQLERGVRSGPLVSAFRKPPLRVRAARALARAAANDAGAMIDVSDGLLRDLGHVCRASKVSASLDVDAVPLARGLRGSPARVTGPRRAEGRPGPPRAAARSQGGTPIEPSLRRPAIEYALGGGDDYELLFTTRPNVREAKLRASCEAEGCVVSRIGTIARAARTLRITDAAGRPLDVTGFEHFAKQP